MDLGSLEKPKGSTRNRRRVGRGQGSGLGKTCGKGHKGQQSRSGYKRKPWSEGGQMPLHRRVPKRGFRSLNRTTFQIVNLAQLANKFTEPTEIGPEKLREAGLIRNLDEPVKILGDGELAVAHTVMVQACSKSARTKLEAAGGKVEII